ncbi:hypothetical protein E5206_09570 [Arthrobacter sp. PAMC25564]|nr:hypothetical protein E5206_09570 [Arthrobacter sp. PAMC25564]
MLEDSHEDWHEDALATIIGLAAAHEIFSADDLAREMRRPPHPNAPGQAFSAARAAGYITAIGYQQSSTKSRKNGVIRVWRRTERRSA